MRDAEGMDGEHLRVTGHGAPGRGTRVGPGACRELVRRSTIRGGW